MQQEPISPEGWAKDLATPLTINGLARALLEPPLVLSPLLSQLDIPTNGRHRPITLARKELAEGSIWRRSWGACRNGE